MTGKSGKSVQKKSDAGAKSLFCLLKLKETLTLNDATATTTSKQQYERFNRQNNNFARASQAFFVHFFAVFAPL